MIIKKQKLREFGLIFGIGIPIFFGLLIPYIFGHGIKIWILIIGIPFIPIALINPYLLIYLYKVWMKIGIILGFINSRLLLGIVFIFILIPISFFMKLIGYDPLRIKSKDLKSYKIYKQENKINLNRIF